MYKVGDRVGQSSGKPVDHFEEGKWYKWVGPGSPRLVSVGAKSSSAWETGQAFRCIGGGNTSGEFADLPGDCCWGYGKTISCFREVPAPTVHDSVNCRCQTLGQVITDKIVGKSDDFNPASVKTRAQRRAEILHGLTID